MSDGTDKTIITSPADLLGTPDTERKEAPMPEPSYDPGAVPRGRHCQDHPEMCEKLGVLTAQSDAHEKRGDRIERTIDGIDRKLDGLSEKSARVDEKVSGFGTQITAVQHQLSMGVKSRWTGKDWAAVILAFTSLIVASMSIAENRVVLQHQNSTLKTEAPAAVSPATHIVAHP